MFISFFMFVYILFTPTYEHIANIFSFQYQVIFGFIFENKLHISRVALIFYLLFS